MKTLLILPIAAAALGLAACSPSNTTENATLGNDVVLNVEGDSNLTVPEDGLSNDVVANDVLLNDTVAANDAAPVGNGL